MARINHITSVKNLRNFIAFDASNVKLAKNEAIYANNGSGKTNISRLFYYLKNPELNINDLLSREANETDRIEFVIDFDGTIINQDNYKDAPIQDLLKLVQVFNSDFRDVNISCPDFGDKHLESELVIEVGEPDTRAKQIKKQISDAENQIKKMHTSISNDFSAYIEGIKGSEFKANETNIWRHCSLESIIDPATKKIETEYLNSLTEKRQADKLAVSVQKRNDLLDLEGQEELKYSQLELPTPDINRIDDVLAVINEFPDVDEDTEANFKSISHWLSHEVLAEGSSTEKVLLTGISLSEDDAKCILCKRALDHESKELFQSYEAYLNAEKSKFVQKIKDMNVELLVIMDKAKAINNNVGAEVNRLSKLFEIDDKWIEYDTEKLLNALETYSVLLHEKTNDISVSFGYIELNNARLLIESINDKIRKNTLLTEKLDRKIDNTVSQLAEQRKYIGQKLLLDFYKTKKDSFDLIKSSFVAIEVDKTKLSKILESLPTIDSRSNISKLMNYFLHDRVGIDKYNSEVIDDQIVIKLNGFNISQSTRLISEGEQTILGLCYFLASSIDELNNIEDFSKAIFIIDDPVSSTAYANFFGISTLIKKFAHDIKKELWAASEDPSIQTLVLTHNIQFLNLLKKQVWRDTDPKNGFSILSSSCIKRIPQGQLLSEFQTAMWRVYKKTTMPEFDDNVSNDIRRIAETLKHFYGLSGDFNSESLIKIFPYAEGKNYDVLYTVINHFSHGSPEDPDVLPPDSVDSAAVDIAAILEHKQSPFSEMWESIKKYEND